MTNEGMYPETRYVCERCAHTWDERRPEGDDPMFCEACGHKWLQVFPLHIVGNGEAAEEFSQSVLDRQVD